MNLSADLIAFTAKTFEPSKILSKELSDFNLSSNAILGFSLDTNFPKTLSKPNINGVRCTNPATTSLPFTGNIPLITSFG